MSYLLKFCYRDWLDATVWLFTKESRGQAPRHSPELSFEVESMLCPQAGDGRASPPPGCMPPGRKPCRMQMAKLLRSDSLKSNVAVMFL